MILEFQIFFGFFAFLFLTILISNIIKKKRTNKQRSTSSMRCHYCGEPMLESDVFCENCWKITPKVQKMLRSHPDRKPEFYSNLSYKGHNHCPHCKAFYCHSRSIRSTITHDIPIKYCTNCHQFFLDTWYFEWSIASLSIKLEAFFFFRPYIFFFFIPILIICIIERDWYILHDIGILFLEYSALRLIWHTTAKRKAIRESYMRLEQNPEYPQILVDMGFINMMDKKFYHLSRTPPLSWKDRVNELKEFLKEAFTFN